MQPPASLPQRVCGYTCSECVATRAASSECVATRVCKPSRAFSLPLAPPRSPSLPLEHEHALSPLPSLSHALSPSFSFFPSPSALYPPNPPTPPPRPALCKPVTAPEKSSGRGACGQDDPRTTCRLVFSSRNRSARVDAAASPFVLLPWSRCARKGGGGTAGRAGRREQQREGGKGGGREGGRGFRHTLSDQRRM